MFAAELEAENRPVVLHAVSGAFWTMLYTLQHLDRDWKEQNVRAVVLDSCPPKSDIYAFGGWLAFRVGQPSLMPFLAQLFPPYRYLCGITPEWEAANYKRMYGASSVIPRKAHCLFLHDRCDPVLNKEYISSFVKDVKKHAHDSSLVTEVILRRARHAMGMVDAPKQYYEAHSKLLGELLEQGGRRLPSTTLAPQHDGFRIDLVNEGCLMSRSRIIHVEAP